MGIFLNKPEKDFRVGPGFFEVNHDQAVFLTTTVIESKQ